MLQKLSYTCNEEARFTASNSIYAQAMPLFFFKDFHNIHEHVLQLLTIASVKLVAKGYDPDASATRLSPFLHSLKRLCRKSFHHDISRDKLDCVNYMHITCQ